MQQINGSEWVEIRDPYTGKLLCRFKRDRLLLELKRGRVKTVVDLRQYEKERDEERT